MTEQRSGRDISTRRNQSDQRVSSTQRNQSDQRVSSTRRNFLKLGATTLSLGAISSLSGCVFFPSSGISSSPNSMRIFHAGSLAPPFDALSDDLKTSENPVDVNRESRGSVASTNKITELGRRADVLAVSDFRLLRDRIIPEYSDWYVVFATNAMTVHYTGEKNISTDNWFEVLSGDVKIGHSDPATDPGGYRAVMAQKLGKTEFEPTGKRLYDESVYTKIRKNSYVTTDTEINLVAQLESDEIDYAISYRSIGETADVEHVELQPEVDLSKFDSEYARHYSKAKVETESGVFVGSPIAYAMTVPKIAKFPELGVRFIEHAISDRGQEVMRNHGFDPLESPVLVEASEGTAPETIRKKSRTGNRIGPLNLTGEGW